MKVVRVFDLVCGNVAWSPVV